MQEEHTQAVNLKNATEQLMVQITSWKQRCLLKNPIGGKHEKKKYKGGIVSYI